MKTDHIISADPIARESRPSEGRKIQELSWPIGSGEDHMIGCHKLHPKAGEQNGAFLTDTEVGSGTGGQLLQYKLQYQFIFKFISGIKILI